MAGGEQARISSSIGRRRRGRAALNPCCCMLLQTATKLIAVFNIVVNVLAILGLIALIVITCCAFVKYAQRNKDAAEDDSDTGILSTTNLEASAAIDAVLNSKSPSEIVFAGWGNRTELLWDKRNHYHTSREAEDRPTAAHEHKEEKPGFNEGTEMTEQLEATTFFGPEAKRELAEVPPLTLLNSNEWEEAFRVFNDDKNSSAKKNRTRREIKDGKITPEEAEEVVGLAVLIILFIMYDIYLLIGFLLFAASMKLLSGANERNHVKCQFFLTVKIVFLILNILSFFIQITYLSQTLDLSFNVIFIAFSFYEIWVVHAFIQELKDEEESIHQISGLSPRGRDVAGTDNNKMTPPSTVAGYPNPVYENMSTFV